MVKLTIHPYRGNTNSKYFTHVGYLGLTPVKVEGVARTKIEADGKPVLASSIVVSVRCIESRLSRLGVAHSNTLAEYTQILWTKPPGLEWAEVGELELPFKIVVPAKTPGFSCTNFQDYRVHWRVEAVMHHSHIFAVGNRQIKAYDLWLQRYDIPRLPRETMLSPARCLQVQKPRPPGIRYQLLTPTNPVGPLDIVTIPVVIHPMDPSVVLRSINLLVERRIDLSETSVLPSRQTPTSSPLFNTEEEDSSNSTIRANNNNETGSSSTVKLSTESKSTLNLPGEPPSSNRLGVPTPIVPMCSTSTLSSTYTAESYGSSIEQRPLLQPIMTDLPSKSVNLTVLAVEGQGPFVKDADGVYNRSLTLQWPATKPSSHWAMGETMKTEMINVRFFIRVKIIVSSPSTGTESIELEERELFLIATNESDRKLALSKYSEFVQRSKSKSPRRSAKREPPSPSPSSDSTDTQALSVPHHHAHSLPPLAYSYENMKSPSAASSSKSRRPVPTTSASAPALRRPHTSAGPRDKANRTHHRQRDDHERERERPRHRDTEPPPLPVVHTPRRPDTALPALPSTKPATATSSSKSFFFSSSLKPYWDSGASNKQRERDRDRERRERGSATIAGAREGHTPPHAHAAPPIKGSKSAKSSRSAISASSTTDDDDASTTNGGRGLGKLSGQKQHNEATETNIDPVRAWERELERIETQSRRSTTDMLGFFRRVRSSRSNTASSSTSSTSESS